MQEPDEVAAAGGSTSLARPVAESGPCYLELGMREEGDRRLASVYKPEQRAKLQVSTLAIPDALRALKTDSSQLS